MVEPSLSSTVMTVLLLSQHGEFNYMNTSNIARMGLGLAALGRPGYINLGHKQDMCGDISEQMMEQRCHQVLDAAWAVGVRYFDVAASYGRSEAFLASWLKARGYKPVVGSKWGYYYTADWQVEAIAHEIKEHEIERLDEQWQSTQEAIGQHLDLYQIHSATFESGVLQNAEVLKRLASLKEHDVLIGLTLSGINQSDVLREAMSIEIDGVRLFDSVQATWNLLERSAGDALADANENGMEVIVKEGLANGRLTDRNTSSNLDALRARANELEVNIDTLALAAILSQPWANMVLSGAATTAQLSSNLEASHLYLEPDELLEIAEPVLRYWTTRSNLRWN